MWNRVCESANAKHYLFSAIQHVIPQINQSDRIPSSCRENDEEVTLLTELELEKSDTNDNLATVNKLELSQHYPNSNVTL